MYPIVHHGLKTDIPTINLRFLASLAITIPALRSTQVLDYAGYRQIQAIILGEAILIRFSPETSIRECTLTQYEYS